MVIPQGMAYAMLAGLPPIMGLYASTIPLLVYALLGSSRQLAVGPVAMASLVMAAGVNELVPPEVSTTELLVEVALLLTLIAGASQILLGLLQMGGLVNLLSHPVVSGFTAAAALIIGASQLQHLLGFSVPRGHSALETLQHVGENIEQTNMATLGVGVATIIVIVGLRRISPRIPAALIAVTLGIAASYLVNLESMGVRILGHVPSGLPTPVLPDFTLDQIRTAAPMGLTIGLIAFMESISAAKIYARQNRYTLGPTQELVSLGLANITASLFGGYVVGGALSRTAVNAQAGARTPLAGVVTALVVMTALAVLTPLFYYLPTPVLAAIILVAVVGLLDVDEAIHLWQVKRDDLAILVITFFATLFVSIEGGLLVGVAASLLWLIYTTTRPEIAALGRIPGTNSYRSVDHFDSAIVFEQILILRMDAQFFFGNVVYLKDRLFTLLDQTDDPVALVLDASSMNSLDSTAADTYGELITDLRGQHVEVFISHVKGSVLQMMDQTKLLELLGDGHIFYEVDHAVQAALRHRAAVRRGVELAEEDFGPSDPID